LKKRITRLNLQNYKNIKNKNSQHKIKFIIVKIKGTPSDYFSACPTYIRSHPQRRLRVKPNKSNWVTIQTFFFKFILHNPEEGLGRRRRRR
jgi:hypothetical protein